MTPINREEIQSQLRNQIIGQKILAFGDIRSTNEYAKRLARSGEPEGCLVIAEHQTRGKGRLNRFWYSPGGQGLWFSIILRPDIEIKKSSLFALLAAVSVSQAIETVTTLKTELKWPNDILVHGKKMCGILIESDLTREKLDFLVMGIGINVSQKKKDFDHNLRNRATSLFIETKYSPNRIKLLIAVLHSLESYYEKLKSGQVAEILDSWLLKCRHREKPIIIHQGHYECEGIFEGVDEYGRMVLRTSDGNTQIVASGEVFTDLNLTA